MECDDERTSLPLVLPSLQRALQHALKEISAERGRQASRRHFTGGKGQQPDTKRRRTKTSNQVRHIRLEGPDTLDAAPVRALMAEAVARSAKPFDDAQPNRMVIRAVNAKQRPRHPAPTTKKGR